MGVNLKELVVKKEIELGSLSGKILVIDAYNNLYQYLTTIRARDGALLMDSGGQVTSHLVGLFSRTANLMQRGMKLAFVFDGKPPEFKRKTQQMRAAIKKEAEEKWAKA